MAYDGIQFGSRVDGTTQRDLHAKVVDNILSAPTYFSRLLSMGKPFLGKTEDITIDVVSDTQGEFFIGLETLNSAAANTTVTLSYAQTAFTQPEVSIMLESFANTGAAGIIPLAAFKHEKAAAEVLQRFGSAVYADGSANRPLGLGAIVDDGTAVGTIGGQSRTTYTTLKATRTNASGAITLAKMATLWDAVSAAGLQSQEPNMGLSNATVWSLYEQLLQPNVRNDYSGNGYPSVSIRGSNMEKAQTNGAGFSSLSYRGRGILKDNFATAETLFFLNESYFDWMGRAIVPDEYKEMVEKVNLGTSKAYEGTGAEALNLPSEYNGFFYQKKLQLPNQAGMIARFYVIGQVVAKGFRRSGKLYGITTV
jgi:hypothetical protein